MLVCHILTVFFETSFTISITCLNYYTNRTYDIRDVYYLTIKLWLSLLLSQLSQYI